MKTRVILFQNRFALIVQAGIKRQTVRKVARCSRGDIVSLREWAGRPYRSKQRILRTAAVEAVDDCRISHNRMSINGLVLSEKEADAFATADGFNDFSEMLGWFEHTHSLPFSGQVIRWISRQAPTENSEPRTAN